MYHLALGSDQEEPDQGPDFFQALLEESLRAINQLKQQVEDMEVEVEVWARVDWCQEVLGPVAWALEEDKVERALNQVMVILATGVTEEVSWVKEVAA